MSECLLIARQLEILQQMSNSNLNISPDSSFECSVDDTLLFIESRRSNDGDDSILTGKFKSNGTSGVVRMDDLYGGGKVGFDMVRISAGTLNWPAARRTLT